MLGLSIPCFELPISVWRDPTQQKTRMVSFFLPRALQLKQSVQAAFICLADPYFAIPFHYFLFLPLKASQHL